MTNLNFTKLNNNDLQLSDLFNYFILNGKKSFIMIRELALEIIRENLKEFALTIKWINNKESYVNEQMERIKLLSDDELINYVKKVNYINLYYQGEEIDKIKCN